MTTIHPIEPDATTFSLLGEAGKSPMQLATGAGIVRMAQRQQ
jgi:hypothetical protein